jgi:hypothetical protein
MREWQIRELSKIALEHTESSMEREIQTSSKPGSYTLRASPGVVDLPRDVSILTGPDQGCAYCWKRDEEVF